MAASTFGHGCWSFDGCGQLLLITGAWGEEDGCARFVADELVRLGAKATLSKHDQHEVDVEALERNIVIYLNTHGEQARHGERF